jgi:hypothetical protein
VRRWGSLELGAQGSQETWSNCFFPTDLFPRTEGVPSAPPHGDCPKPPFRLVTAPLLLQSWTALLCTIVLLSPSPERQRTPILVRISSSPSFCRRHCTSSAGESELQARESAKLWAQKEESHSLSVAQPQLPAHCFLWRGVICMVLGYNVTDRAHACPETCYDP